MQPDHNKTNVYVSSANDTYHRIVSMWYLIVATRYDEHSILDAYFIRQSINDPMIFFCDEPTTGLDTFMAEEIVRLMKVVMVDQLLVQ